jgi:5-methylcytosine-specific restriction endonuclease McrA
MRLCSGCQTKIPDGVRYCAACTAERKPVVSTGGGREHTVTDRVRYAFLYASERWKRNVQPRAVKKYPLCARCFVAVTELIDHVVPAGEAIRQAQVSGRYPYSKYEGFYFMSNLQGLCRSCHFIKTTEDKAHAGEWPDVVAIEAAAPKKVWSF